MTPSAAIDRLKALAKRPDDAIDLCEAAILIGLAEDPCVEPEEVHRELEALAERARARVPERGPVLPRLRQLTQFLFDEEGFAGNEGAYYEVANSCIHRVLERRLGIPITLSIVLMEVGRQVGLEMDGVGFPTHFLVTPRDAPSIFIDAFHHGHILGYDECRGLFEVAVAGRLPFDERYLQPASTRYVLTRMLQNLKFVHLREGETERAITTLDQALALTPDSNDLRRERGLLRLRARDLRGGISDLEEYLVRAPTARDAAMIRLSLVDARQRLLSVH
ncbi:MAG: transglutaminase-like domain-containing protein [Nannocystaceae bacterium]